MELRGHSRAVKIETVHGRWMSPAYVPGLVSVIIPAYNRSRLLPETLGSLLDQTYRPLEIVVVDDGSTDDTSEVVDRWISEYGSADGLSVSYLRQPNRGAPAARNRGLIESRGEFIQFLDSDDLLSKRKIELGVEALQADPRVELAYGPTELLGEFNSAAYPGLTTNDPQQLLEAACRRSVWTIMGPIYRRELCVKSGPWLEELSCWQDREYALRILARSPVVRFASESVSYYRLGHGPSIGDEWFRSQRDLHSILLGAEAAAQAIEDGCGFTPLIRERLAQQFIGAGRHLGQLGHVESARSALRRAQQIAHGSSYFRTVALLRLITRLAGFPLVNRCLRLRARLRGRPAGVGA